MRIGIICEGVSDRAVIENVIIGITGLDTSDFEPLRPQDNFVETDIAAMDPNLFSTWSVVKKECEEREKIEMFLQMDGQELVVIHLDSAEADAYGIDRPHKKDANYNETLRNLIVAKIDEWLENEYLESILHAIAIEEIEAWILTIYEKNDSSKTIDPKQKLKNVLSKERINSTEDYDNYSGLSESLSKKKKIVRGQFYSYNYSLRAFVEEVQMKYNDRLDKLSLTFPE